VVIRMLQWLLDDERLKPDRSTREVHPIPDAPDLPLEQRVHHLECHLGRLWDHVWYLNQPWYRRVGFRLLGFTPPIPRFYLKPGEKWLP
jgi:hypothetical protein